MSYEIWLMEKTNKKLCFVGTTRDHRSGAWTKNDSENVLSFIVQNEGNEISVIDGHSASHLSSTDNFSIFEPTPQSKKQSGDKMKIRVNWNQGKVATDGLIRAHQILGSQPEMCQFDDMKGDFDDYPDVKTAETAMKQKGYRKYKHCSHCWDKKIGNVQKCVHGFKLD